jgi:orotidine-5'-phosphate decarboxylase
VENAGMTESFAGRFAGVRERVGPLVFGADPHGPVLAQWGLSDDADGLERFADIVLEAADGAFGVLKPQSAFYERHGWRGVRVLSRLVSSAREQGILVIMDAKRGGDAPLRSDALTVHPYLGLGAMDAYVRRAHACGAALFVVTRSSNPEGRAVQGAQTAGGTAVEEQVLGEIGSLNDSLSPGAIGPVGAVIAPDPALPPLKLAAANALFLAPGVGAQGATPADVAATFAACPDRVLPSVSRSLLSAGPDSAALRSAAARLNEEFRSLLGLS